MDNEPAIKQPTVSQNLACVTSFFLLYIIPNYYKSISRQLIRTINQGIFN